MDQDLAVITCHFNFCDYKAPQVNLRRFLRHMAYTGVQVFGIELYLEHQQPVTSCLAGWLQYQVASDAVLWQKEALINAVARRVPKRFTKLAWIDADLSFNSHRWVDELKKKLDDHPVVQPFERCHWTNPNGEIISSKESVFKTGMTNVWSGHPGFAMAAQRSFFEICGLYDAGVIGNGDTILAASLTHRKAIDWLCSISYNGKFGFNVPTTKARYMSWSETVHAFGRLGKGVAYLEGIEVVHDWHGDKKDRQYQERYAWLADFDVDREIERSEEGYLKWTKDACPKRVEAAKLYFSKRHEDGRSDPSKRPN